VNPSPFVPDRAVAERIDGLRGTVAVAFERALRASITEGAIVPAAAAEQLVARFGLRGPREVMLLALPVATRFADPPLSGFHVGAVGLESESGDLILGGNLEFPGSDLSPTIHGEGFVATRAFARDRSLASLATGEARPCGHCRQTLSEAATAAELELIDPLGHTLRLADLYPWPFIPADLGETGIVVGAVPWPDLSLEAGGLPIETAALLVRTGRRAHVPYGRCPAAIVLRLRDGRLVGGTTIESVAFNPTIGPLQAAAIELAAHGDVYTSIESAVLAITPDGEVDPTESTRSLLAAVAPDATLTVTTWA
jgi:cytidine deaminase